MGRSELAARDNWERGAQATGQNGEHRSKLSIGEAMIKLEQEKFDIKSIDKIVYTYAYRKDPSKKTSICTLEADKGYEITHNGVIKRLYVEDKRQKDEGNAGQERMCRYQCPHAHLSGIHPHQGHPDRR